MKILIFIFLFLLSAMALAQPEEAQDYESKQSSYQKELIRRAKENTTSLEFFETKKYFDSVYSSEGGIYVGNGGEGIYDRHELYLRDLFDYGVHRDPYIGEYRDPIIVEATEPFDPIQIGVPEDLFVRKLSDLESIHMGLGLYVLEVVRYYDWVFVDGPMTPFPDDGSALATLVNRVVIANRFQRTIRIHRPSWDILNAENKLALILHESLFSLLKPVCYDSSNCIQEAHKIRDLVGKLFKKHTFYGSEDLNLNKFLMIPLASDEMPLESFPGNTLFINVGKTEYQLLNASNVIEQKIFFKKICSNLEVNKNQNVVSLRLFRSPYQIVEWDYPVTVNDFIYRQISLQIKLVDSSKTINFEIHELTGNKCFRSLRAATDSWY